MWEYNSRTHVLTENTETVPNGDKCYSGTGEGRNNPDMENVAGVGPIPRGRYRIGPSYKDEHGLGPCVMHLDPLPGTETFGRDLFRIHGNDAENDASHGCLIAPPDVRGLIDKSRDRILLVS